MLKQSSALLALTFSFLFFSTTHAALVTTSISGETAECNPAAPGVCNVGDPFTLDISFDDSLYDSILGAGDIQSLVVSDEQIGFSIDYVVQAGLDAADLQIDLAGNVVGGAITVSPLFNAIFGTFLISIDFDGIISPFGSTVNFISFRGEDDLYLASSCFDGYSCNAVPLPAGAWLFGSAVAALLGFRARKN